MSQISLAAIRHYAGHADLGVCLGHQAIAQVLAPLSCEPPK
jgi:anthranilate/para-aminobenzoate synthase component II